MTRAVTALLLLVSVALVGATAVTTRAAADLSTLAVELVPVADGLDEPVFVTTAPGEPGRLYVVEQAGLIRVVGADGVTADTPFLDLTAQVAFGGERGLLGLAFHPDYADNGRFFVDYTRAPDGATVVSQFNAVDGVADPASERQLLVIEQPFENHNGGMIAFDATGMLLIGTGDGGSGGDPFGAGQDPGVLLGKLLRIDVDGGEPYGIPADNGYVDNEIIPARDPRHGPAQPVALQRRSRGRPCLHRGRGTGRLGGGQPASGWRWRPELRLERGGGT